MVTRPLRRAVLVALVAALLCGVNFFVLRGLLESGRLDRSAVLFNVVVTAAALPGLVLARHVCHGARPYDERFLARYFAVVTGATSVLYSLLALVWRPRSRAAERARGSRARSGPVPGPLRGGAPLECGARRATREGAGPDRRAFLRRAAGWSVASGVALVGGYALLVEPRWPRLLRLRLPLQDLPPALHGLRVVHLTDLHLGRYNSAAYLSSVVQHCNRLSPDLVLLTGDYVHGSPRFVVRVAGILGQLRPRLGTLAVLGNHDHWEGAQRSRRALRCGGIGLLDNDRVWITRRSIQRQACPGALCVAGVGDLWEDRVDLDAALGGVDATTPRLLLSHNPDVAETEAARRSGHRVDLMLAGHTHGGQVRLPGSGSLISPSRYGRKYDRGMVQGPRFRVFVSAGIGTTIFPVRLLVRPEIVCFELVANTPRSC